MSPGSLVLAALVPLLAAQGGMEPVDAASPAPEASRLHVRLASRYRWTERVRTAAGEEFDLAPLLAELIEPLPGSPAVRPLFPQPAAVLDRWHREASEAAAAQGRSAPDHLGRWLEIVTDRPEEVLAGLERVPGSVVVDAYREPALVLFGSGTSAHPGNDIPPATPDFTGLQTGICGPAPIGLDFWSLWPVSGGRGRGVTVFHLEVDWYFGHEDVSQLQPSAWLGPPATGSMADRDHATSVIGILAADRNGYGLDGVADEARIRVGSLVGLGGIGPAVAAAAAAARPGDAIALILGFDIQQVKPRDLVPFEYLDACFMAVQTATLRGIHVVEAAGNGTNDLDDPRFGGRFDRAVRDSGAILVGATDGGRLVRQGESNYGERVDVSAWGDAIPATGFGNLFLPGGDVLQTYTDGYGGTSGATSLVTGAVAGISGAISTQLGRVATPVEVRNLLGRHGTSVLGGIGRRPDLRRILAALGLPDGLALDALETPRGGVATGSLRGSAGGQAFLLVAPAPGRLAIPGLNRPLLLDPATTATLAVYPLGGAGTAAVQLPIPSDVGLAGLELELQAATLDPVGGALSLTSSVQLRIR